MENAKKIPKYQISPCYVAVRKLTMEELSRMSLNPFSVTHKCAKCKKRVQYGPKCSSCDKFFHYSCANLRKKCCDQNIISSEEAPIISECPKCRKQVEFGPQCSICNLRYHSSCISLFEQCCQLNLYERNKAPRKCGKCSYSVDFGPKCPLCVTVYHINCVNEELECCGIKFTSDNNSNFKCIQCNRRLALGSPMCPFCGRLSHMHCLRRGKSCCGRRVPLEVYFIPNFSYTLKYYTHSERRRAALKTIKELTRTHKHCLRSTYKFEEKRAKKKSVNLQKISASSQTCALDTVTIVDVKTELDQKELDIPESPPPLLEREDLVPSPEPSSSILVAPESSQENEESLRNLFDFLYNMVKKFPPTLQTQVKIDLFKTVTEAEMKWQCNMVQNNRY